MDGGGDEKCVFIQRAHSFPIATATVFTTSAAARPMRSVDDRRDHTCGGRESEETGYTLPIQYTRLCLPHCLVKYRQELCETTSGRNVPCRPPVVVLGEDDTRDATTHRHHRSRCFHTTIVTCPVQWSGSFQGPCTQRSHICSRGRQDTHFLRRPCTVQRRDPVIIRDRHVHASTDQRSQHIATMMQAYSPVKHCSRRSTEPSTPPQLSHRAP